MDRHVICPITSLVYKNYHGHHTYVYWISTSYVLPIFYNVTYYSLRSYQFWIGMSYILQLLSSIISYSHHATIPWKGNFFLSQMFCSRTHITSYLSTFIGTLVHICAYIWLITIEIMHILLSYIYVASWIISSKMRHILALYFAQNSSFLSQNNATDFIAMCKHCDALYIARGQLCIYLSYLFKFTVYVSYTCKTLGKRICHCEIKLPYCIDIYKCKMLAQIRCISVRDLIRVPLNRLHQPRTYLYIIFNYISIFCLTCDALDIES